MNTITRATIAAISTGAFLTPTAAFAANAYPDPNATTPDQPPPNAVHCTAPNATVPGTNASCPTPASITVKITKARSNRHAHR